MAINQILKKDGGLPPSRICWTRSLLGFATTREEHLVVFVVWQHLGKIDAVVLITPKFEYFARLAGIYAYFKFHVEIAIVSLTAGIRHPC